MPGTVCRLSRQCPHAVLSGLHGTLFFFFFLFNVLTIPRLQEPGQLHSQNLLHFMLKDRWLIIQVVFLHTKLGGNV